MIEPTVMSAVTGFLGAGGATIILRVMDYIHENKKAKRDKENGILTLDEKVDGIAERQEAISEQLRKTNDVVLASARDRILYLCKKKTEEERFTLADLDEVRDIYEPYHADGGNHTAKDAFDLYYAQVMEYQKSLARKDNDDE